MVHKEAGRVVPMYHMDHSRGVARMPALAVGKERPVRKGEELQVWGSRMENPHRSLNELRQFPAPPHPFLTQISVSMAPQYVAENLMRHIQKL